MPGVFHRLLMIVAVLAVYSHQGAHATLRCVVCYNMTGVMTGAGAGQVANGEIGHVTNGGIVSMTENMLLHTLLVTGAQNLTNIIAQIDHTFTKPLTSMHVVNVSVKEIDENIRGLKFEERSKMIDARAKLNVGKSNILRTREVLKMLAIDTMSRTTTIKRIVKMLDSARARKRNTAVRVITQRMRNLLTRSKELVNEATGTYNRVRDYFTAASYQLNAFKFGVHILANPSGLSHKEVEQGIRAQVLDYPQPGNVFERPSRRQAAVAEGERMINEWKQRLHGLLIKCDRAKTHVDQLVTEVTSNLVVLETCERTIQQSIAEVSSTIERYQQSGTSLPIFGSVIFDPVAGLERLIKVSDDFKKNIETIVNAGNLWSPNGGIIGTPQL